jgi:hypothetical protein
LPQLLQALNALLLIGTDHPFAVGFLTGLEDIGSSPGENLGAGVEFPHGFDQGEGPFLEVQLSGEKRLVTGQRLFVTTSLEGGIGGLDLRIRRFAGGEEKQEAKASEEDQDAATGDGIHGEEVGSVDVGG